MKLTEKHEFKITKTQKKTLRVLKDKYKVNTSQFIRNAIEEKLKRDKSNLFARMYKSEYPF